MKIENVKLWTKMEEIELLDHQFEFLQDDFTRHLLLLAGYGAGKTFAFVTKAYDLASKNVGHTGILLEPTAPLLHDILIPDMLSFLEDNDIEHTFIKSPHPNLRIRFEDGETKILMRSLENWQRLIGVNAAFIGTDEMDTVKKEVVLMAYKKLQGRLRKGNVRQMFNTTTPEGFAGAYELFEKMKIGRIIRARTEDNPFLPADFIADLKKNYPKNLLEAYMEGRFVNLTSGTVYLYFSRQTHNSTEEARDGDTLLIGQDFNVGGCVSIVCVQRGDNVIAVDEVISYDTKAVITNLKDRYKNHRIEIYPDASGDNRKTNASETDIELLQQAGLMVYNNSSNPSVKDRVNTVNNLFDKSRLLVNVNKCPRLTEALEQQAYDDKGEPQKSNSHPASDDFNDALGYMCAYKFPIKTYSRISGGFVR